MEEVKVEKSWNKKRIFISLSILVLLVVGIFALKTFVLNQNIDSSKPNSVLHSVKGDKDEQPIKNVFSLPKTSSVQKALKEKLEDVKKEVGNLNIESIASSSPQIQKVINDLNALKQYPINQVKDACLKVCNGL